MVDMFLKNLIISVFGHHSLKISSKQFDNTNIKKMTW